MKVFILLALLLVVGAVPSPSPSPKKLAPTSDPPGNPVNSSKANAPGSPKKDAKQTKSSVSASSKSPPKSKDTKASPKKAVPSSSSQPAHFNVNEDTFIEIHSKKTKPKTIKKDDIKNLKKSEIEKSHKTIIFIHGLFPVNVFKEELKDAYFKSKNITFNFISINWEKGLGDWMEGPNTERVMEIGVFIVDMIVQMTKHELIAPDNVELIGHCVGAHIAGWVGKQLEKKNGKKLPKIVGLDPLTTDAIDANKLHTLNTNDTNFLLIIHSNVGVLGSRDTLGHADIHLNDLVDQPQCPTIIEDFGVCSHIFALVYFIFVIGDDYPWSIYPINGTENRNDPIDGNNFQEWGINLEPPIGIYHADFDPNNLNGNQPNGLFGGFNASTDTLFEIYNLRNINSTTVSKASLKDSESLESSFEHSKFNKSLPTIFLIHGFQTTSTLTAQYIQAYFVDGKHDVNLIGVDWDAGAKQITYLATTRNHVGLVGNVTGEFIHKAVTKGLISLDKVEIIGHSLGAHIAGYAGKRFKVLSNPLNLPEKEIRIPKITALDAAGPNYGNFLEKLPGDVVGHVGRFFNNHVLVKLFGEKARNNLVEKTVEDERLRKIDADFVLAIHTNGRFNGFSLGFTEEFGHVDIFLNGGEEQPAPILLRVPFVIDIWSHNYSTMFHCKLINRVMPVIGFACATREICWNKRKRKDGDRVEIRIGLSKAHEIIYVDTNGKENEGEDCALKGEAFVNQCLTEFKERVGSVVHVPADYVDSLKDRMLKFRN